jgi:hypothetical protein
MYVLVPVDKYDYLYQDMHSDTGTDMDQGMSMQKALEVLCWQRCPAEPSPHVSVQVYVCVHVQHLSA